MWEVIIELSQHENHIFNTHFQPSSNCDIFLAYHVHLRLLMELAKISPLYTNGNFPLV